MVWGSRPRFGTKLRQALYVARAAPTVLIPSAVVVRINQRLRAQIQRQAELLARAAVESVGEVAASLAHGGRILTAIKTFVDMPGN